MSKNRRTNPKNNKRFNRVFDYATMMCALVLLSGCYISVGSDTPKSEWYVNITIDGIESEMEVCNNDSSIFSCEQYLIPFSIRKWFLNP